MYPVTKGPWSVWRDAGIRQLRDSRRMRAASLLQLLRQRFPNNHLPIDWARYDLPNLAIFLPANFDRVEQLERSSVAPKRLDNPWWIKDMYPLSYPRTYIMPTPQVKSYVPQDSKWIFVLWLAGLLSLIALPAFMVFLAKIFSRNFRRCQSSEWERPSVRATAVPLNSIDSRTGAVVAIPSSTPPQRLDSIFENELPPPYPACVAEPRQHQNPSEDPPPPYSECCVAFSNTNEPQVHFYINQSNNLPDVNFVSKVDVNDTRQAKGNEVTDTSIEGSSEGMSTDSGGVENSGTHEENTKAICGNSNGPPNINIGLAYVTLSFDLPECDGTNERTNDDRLSIA